MQDEEDPLRYARLLRPFPTKRLAEKLYYVQADAHAIERKLIEVLVNPPQTPERWRAELQALDDLLDSLTERCTEVRPVLARMVEQSDGDFERAVTAMLGILRGLAQAPRDEVAA